MILVKCDLHLVLHAKGIPKILQIFGDKATKSQKVSLCSLMPPILLYFEMNHLNFAVDFALLMPKHSNTVVLFLHLSNIRRKPHVQMHNSNTKADCTFKLLLGSEQICEAADLKLSLMTWVCFYSLF